MEALLEDSRSLPAEKSHSEGPKGSHEQLPPWALLHRIHVPDPTPPIRRDSSPELPKRVSQLQI